MVNMETLNDAELLENVGKRFLKDLIFTYVGPTLLVVNPFKKIPSMALEETRMEYIKHIIPSKDPLAYKEKPPNVFAIAWYCFLCIEARLTALSLRMRRTRPL
jgi:myosin heavy subunit